MLHAGRQFAIWPAGFGSLTALLAFVEFNRG